MIYIALFCVVFVIVIMAISLRKPKSKDLLSLDEYHNERVKNYKQLAKQNEEKKELGPVACGLLESFKNEKEKWDASITFGNYNPRGEGKLLVYNKDIYITAYVMYGGTKTHWIYHNGINARFTDYEHEVLSKYIWENFETETERLRKETAEQAKKNAEYFANMCPNNKK